MANLSLSKGGFKKGANPFIKLKDDSPIKLDPKSMMKLGQVTEESAEVDHQKFLVKDRIKKDPKVDLQQVLRQYFVKRLFKMNSTSKSLEDDTISEYLSENEDQAKKSNNQTATKINFGNFGRTQSKDEF